MHMASVINNTRYGFHGMIMSSTLVLATPLVSQSFFCTICVCFHMKPLNLSSGTKDPVLVVTKFHKINYEIGYYIVTHNS